NSLVKDVLTPLIGAVAKTPDFSSLVITVNANKINYGSFINNIISFLIVALAVYLFVVMPINRFSPKKAPDTKKCPECLSDIPLDAKRCRYCTVDLTSP